MNECAGERRKAKAASLQEPPIANFPIIYLFSHFVAVVD